MSQIDAFNAESQYIVTGLYLAECFGVSDRQIRNYAGDGMPTLARDKYDIRQACQWWADNIKAPAKSLNEVTARSKLAEAQREKVELEISEKKGKLIPAEVVQSVLFEVATAIASLHDGFGPRNAAILADESNAGAIQRYLFTEMRVMREEIARGFEKIGVKLENVPRETPKKKRVSKKKTTKKKAVKHVNQGDS